MIFFSSAMTFNSIKCSVKQETRFVENRHPSAGSISRTGNYVLLRSSRENILLDGMGADLSRPVVPSESRLRSYDVSDVIVIIRIIMCHVGWSPSRFKSPEHVLPDDCAVWTVIVLFRNPWPRSTIHMMESFQKHFISHSSSIPKHVKRRQRTNCRWC